MKRETSLVFGILLVLGGALFLLQNLGVFGTGIDILWPILFALGGLIFLYVFVTNRTQWWAVIPGMALLGLGVMMGLDTIGLQMGRLGRLDLFGRAEPGLLARLLEGAAELVGYHSWWCATDSGRCCGHQRNIWWLGQWWIVFYRHRSNVLAGVGAADRHDAHEVGAHPRWHHVGDGRATGIRVLDADQLLADHTHRRGRDHDGAYVDGSS